MNRAFAVVCALSFAAGCQPAEVEPVNPLPPFEIDCGEMLNDNVETASGLEAIDGTVYNTKICEDDVDYYRIDVPPRSHVTIELTMGGSGRGNSDLDLWEVQDPNDPSDDMMFFRQLDNQYSNVKDMDDDVLWVSDSQEPYERIAFFNANQGLVETEATGPRIQPTVSHFIAVDGYDDAAADYTLKVTVTEWHAAELDCDDVFEDSSEDGECNRLVQFPQATVPEDGYLATHWAHYSNLRREVAYLVQYAAAETAAEFPGTAPLALLDMSQRDGDVPGRMEGRLRHPEGTHVDGNDIDIAYYQTGDDNLGRIVCTEFDQYFCLGPANLLEPRRTAFFMIRLIESPYARVIGVDPEVASDLKTAALELQDEGIISFTERNKLNQYMAYGPSWPFHHHHMHFSWNFEGGWGDRSNHVAEGCQNALHQPERDKVRTGVGLD